MEKTLVITYHKDAYFYPFVKNKNIYIEEPIRKKNNIYKVLFRIPFLSIFTYNFLDKLNGITKVIIFDSAYNWALGFYLTKIKKLKNVYLYYWNPVKKMYPQNGDKMVLNAKKMMKVFSFDHDDCQKYGLEYAPMVYSKDVAIEIKNTDADSAEYDLFFLGWKKDRYEQLLQLYNKYIKGKLKAKIIMVGNEEDSDVEEDFTFSSRKYKYEEYLEFVMNSKAILDIPQVGQEGLTIRNVESIFLKKKLVTTKKNIKDYDFYNSDNIFILGEDDSEQLDKFIHSKYIDVNEEIKRNYEFEYWIKQME